MHCHDCFHNNVCGNSSPYNDVTMCKQFIERRNVLCGSALQVVIKDYDDVKERNKELKTALRNCELRQISLEREVELLRIIKQTLEMQSGMKFEF